MWCFWYWHVQLIAIFPRHVEKLYNSLLYFQKFLHSSPVVVIIGSCSPNSLHHIREPGILIGSFYSYSNAPHFWHISVKQDFLFISFVSRNVHKKRKNQLYIFENYSTSELFHSWMKQVFLCKVLFIGRRVIIIIILFYWIGHDLIIYLPF